MKIAAITVAKDDNHLLESWFSHYEVYKKEIHLHIIVDNGSTTSYKAKLRRKFAASKIIERTYNGGTTAAYNDGIRFTLACKEIDSIALVAQDVKFEKNALSSLHKLLFSSKKYGLVGPVLLKRDSYQIESYGSEILKNLMIKRLYHNETLRKTTPELIEVDLVPGGANLAKRKVYEKVGLQDESLFMYGDETDFDIRIKQAGYKLLVTTIAKSWHQHINTSGNKYHNNLAFYYNNRNIILLNYLYSDRKTALVTFSRLFFIQGPKYILGFFLEREYSKSFFYLFGLIAGLLKYRNNWLRSP